MNINITGRNIDITGAMRQHIADKINQVLEKYKVTIIDVHIVLRIERYLHTAEITCNLKGHSMFASESSGDMYSSIDASINKILKQLKRYRDRIKDHKTERKGERGKDENYRFSE